MKKKQSMKKHKVINKRSNKQIVNIIDTSKQLDLPFADTTLQHHDNEPRDDYSNLISTIETASIFSCKPAATYTNKHDFRNYSDQIISVRNNKEGIKTIQISAGRSNTKLPNGKIETEYGFLDFNDELVLSVIIKLIALEQIKIEAATEKNTIDKESERVYTLVTSFRQLIEETAILGKKINYPILRKSLEKLQSTQLEVEYEDHTRTVSMIDRYNIAKAKRPRDSKLLIQVSGLIADAVEENHSYHIYNHLTTYSSKNQIAVWLKKEILTYHKNMQPQKPLLLKLDEIYLNSNLFNLSAKSHVNKQKLQRSLKYLVERKVTAKEIIAIYNKHQENKKKIEPHEWEMEIIEEIHSAPSLYFAMLKLHELMSYRKNYPDLVKSLQNLFNELVDEAKIKIFEMARFCKINNQQYLEVIANKALIDELKKINYSIKAKKKL